MQQRKLQRRLDQPDAMAFADSLDAGDPLENVLRRLGIVVIGAGLGSCRQDAGIVGAAKDDTDAALLAERQEGRQRLLFQQRVAPGKQEQVEIAALG